MASAEYFWRRSSGLHRYILKENRSRAGKCPTYPACTLASRLKDDQDEVSPSSAVGGLSLISLEIPHPEAFAPKSSMPSTSTTTTRGVLARSAPARRLCSILSQCKSSCKPFGEPVGGRSSKRSSRGGCPSHSSSPGIPRPKNASAAISSPLPPMPRCRQTNRGPRAPR